MSWIAEGRRIPNSNDRRLDEHVKSTALLIALGFSLVNLLLLSRFDHNFVDDLYVHYASTGEGQFKGTNPFLTIYHGMFYRPTFFLFHKFIYNLFDFAYPFTYFALVHTAVLMATLVASFKLLALCLPKISSRLYLLGCIFTAAVMLGMFTIRSYLWWYSATAQLFAFLCFILFFYYSFKPASRLHSFYLVAVFVFLIFMREDGVILFPLLILFSWLKFPNANRITLTICTVVLAVYFVLRYKVLGPQSFMHTTRDFILFNQGFTGQEWRTMSWFESIGTHFQIVTSNFLTLFFSEPRMGISLLVAPLVQGKAAGVSNWVYINVISSLLSLLILLYVLCSPVFRKKLKLILLILLSVPIMNCLLSFQYVREYVLGVGGMFYALALGASVTMLVLHLRAYKHRIFARLGLAVIAVVSFAWGLRYLSTDLSLLHRSVVYAERYATYDLALLSPGYYNKDSAEFLRKRYVLLHEAFKHEKLPCSRHCGYFDFSLDYN